MANEIAIRLDEAKEKLSGLEKFLGVADKTGELTVLEGKTAGENFWSDTEAAQQTLKRIDELKKSLAPYQEAHRGYEDLMAMNELVAEGGGELLSELMAGLVCLEKQLADLELAGMLACSEDHLDAMVSINAGAGGTESCDWAAMLLRMYLRYCAARGWQCEIVEESAGDGAGYRSVTFMVNGRDAYGYLKAEIGVHRLVRISPFDANKRRHTSFASVFVYPQVDDDIVLEINPSDVRVDTFRAGGAGGQHVNKTDSAVRMTHAPTGIVVQCQTERSQHQNRAVAMKMLRSRLYDLELKKREAEKASLEESKKDIAWGSQIRSYVLQPYQMVKDHRTNLEIGNALSVLDGDLDTLIKAYLLAASF